MNFKTIMEKAVEMKTADLLNILAVLLLVGFIAVFFSGYMLGSSIAQRECFEYFAWYKIGTECSECDSYCGNFQSNLFAEEQERWKD